MDVRLTSKAGKVLLACSGEIALAFVDYLKRMMKVRVKKAGTKDDPRRAGPLHVAALMPLTQAAANVRFWLNEEIGMCA